MPKARSPLFGFRASGVLGGHRRGPRRRAFQNLIAVFASTIDSFIDQVNPNTNYGAASAIDTGIVYAGGSKASWRRSLFNFDLSSLSGSSVLSAHLIVNLTLVAGVGVPYIVSRNTRPATWTELGVTWNTYDGVNNWTSPGGDIDDTTPPAFTFLSPASAGSFTIPGFGPLAADAIANRAGICAPHVRLVDEAPGVTNRLIWLARQAGALAPSLVVEYQ